MRAPDLFGVFQRMFSLSLGLFLLAGCDHDRSTKVVVPEPEPERVNVTGVAVNGPLDGATVRIFGADGQQLGSATTGADGAYHAEVSVPPPYRIEVAGGRLDGEPYAGTLRAPCETTTDCNITPFTTVITLLMDEYGYNSGDARARLAQRLNFDYDPFVRGLIDAMPVDEFDLDRARAHLNGGEGLDAWVDAMLAWIDQPAPGAEPPAGIRHRYTVTADAGEGGTVSPSLTAVDAYGRILSLSLAPDTGYRVDTVSGCDGRLDGLTYTTGPITADCLVNASFTRVVYTVAADAGEGGEVSPASRQVRHGDTGNFTFQPAFGYALEAVSGCGGSLDGNTYTTGPVIAACSVTSRFSLKQYAVNASAGTGGSISPASQTVAHGSAASFTISVGPNYVLDSVSGCGGSLDGSTYTTAVITEGCAISVGFRLRTYVVNASAGEGGSISPATQNVAHGHTASFTLAPAIGYELDAVSGCDGSLSGSTYTTGVITSACAVTASFALKQYSVTASAGEGGTISPAAQSVIHGETASFTVTPASSYSLDAVTGCGGSVTDNTYTTGAITADCSISATFTLNLAAPSLSASVGDGEVTVSWAPVTGADGYDLYYAEESFDPANYSSYAGGTLLVDVSSPRTVSGLSNGMEYFFSAAAKAGSDRRFSALVSATPVAACFGISGDDPQVCSGNGTCPTTDTCECADGFIGEECDVELKFSDGSREHYFPTTTGRIHIIDGPSLPAGETYVWKFEVLATGYWPGREGFNFGVAGYPLANTSSHDLGEFTDEWAYRGRDGYTFAEGIPAPFGNSIRETGDQLMLELNTVSGVLNIYTKRVGQSEFMLEGGRPALTGVFPKEGRVLRPTVSGICWQPCGIKFID